MKYILVTALLALFILKSQLNGFQLNNDIEYSDKSTTNSSILDENSKFDASLKNFLKKNKNNNEDEEDNFINNNTHLINKQLLSGLYGKFIIEVINDSTLRFLDNLNSEKSDNNEFQIELEESCSPFSCEKVMKAKEIENSSNEKKENSDILSDDLNSNEKEIKLHDSNNNDLVRNLDSIDSNDMNQQNEMESFFSRSYDKNGDKQKLVLTDGDNLYVLEEITQNKNGLNEEDELNMQNKEQEIKMHMPIENKEQNLEETNFSGDILQKKGEIKNLQKDLENIEPNLDNNNVDEKTSNENTIDDNIFELSEEELSKKIFEDIKMNNEDKVECYNFSKNENKCNSYKKCTYVNIDQKDICFLDYNYMLFLKNNNCALQSKSSLLSISKDLLENEIINRQLYQLLRNSSNTNFICDTITYSFLTNVVDNTNYEEIFS